ncbi:hypothetical protein CEUSTIGMA_g3419.t1 [Chlamydomonas eustigma]|uniref:Tudor domain-containing protein n=1 Tax=Chlamydomonas eustigma TaxID=1157962 RepID=A0A250WYW7_9CHLO|nr:hypothetical protein CEUSTIGMA_g3419.t1 [Chlamydomonas eustigma]|eukprot:GAX75976.1 hypothetical protein CEUSTIGMA_g3419.t1 [Chlamydomonas eustigma]
MPNVEEELTVVHAGPASQIPIESDAKCFAFRRCSNLDSKSGQRNVESLAPFRQEVIGRKLSMLETKKGRWSDPSEIISFDSSNCKHCVRIEGENSWIPLGSSKFKWVGARRRNEEPNPSFKTGPTKQDSVGRKIRVFWPGMGRYYQGVVKSYDEATDMHRVDYHDGDSLEHELKYEAVIWLDSTSTLGSPTKAQSSSPFKAAAEASTKPPASERPVSVSELPEAATMRTTTPENVPGPRPGRSASLSPDAVTLVQSAESDKRQPVKGQGSSRRLSVDASSEADVEQPKAPPSKRHKKVADAETSSRDVAKAATEEELFSDEEETVFGVPPQKLAVGSRIAMLSLCGSYFIKGRMSGYHPSDGRHRIRNDDGSSRLLNMRGKPFGWVCPRSKAAGYSSQLHAAMVSMGADNIKKKPFRPPSDKFTLKGVSVTERNSQHYSGGLAVPPAEFLSQLPSSGNGRPAHELQGCRVCMFWPADGRWYPGLVLKQESGGRGLLQVLYTDGECEWLNPVLETLLWSSEDHERPQVFGICHGSSPPAGSAARGWRVSVYRRDITEFEMGYVTTCDEAGRIMQVQFDDGSEREISTEKDLVVWRAKPLSDDDTPALAQACSNGNGFKRSSYDMTAGDANLPSSAANVGTGRQQPGSVGACVLKRLKAAVKSKEVRRHPKGSNPRAVPRGHSPMTSEDGAIDLLETEETEDGHSLDKRAAAAASQSSSEDEEKGSSEVDEDDQMDDDDREYHPTTEGAKKSHVAAAAAAGTKQRHHRLYRLNSVVTKRRNGLSPRMMTTESQARELFHAVGPVVLSPNPIRSGALGPPLPQPVRQQRAGRDAAASAASAALSKAMEELKQQQLLQREQALGLVRGAIASNMSSLLSCRPPVVSSIMPSQETTGHRVAQLPIPCELKPTAATSSAVGLCPTSLKSRMVLLDAILQRIEAVEKTHGWLPPAAIRPAVHQTVQQPVSGIKGSAQRIGDNSADMELQQVAGKAMPPSPLPQQLTSIVATSSGANQDIPQAGQCVLIAHTTARKSVRNMLPCPGGLTLAPLSDASVASAANPASQPSVTDLIPTEHAAEVAEDLRGAQAVLGDVHTSRLVLLTGEADAS